MKLISMLCVLAILLTTTRGADESTNRPAAGTAATGGSEFIIDSENGATLIPTNGATLCIITGNVRATEGRTTLTCDSLSILFRGSDTNSPGLSPLSATAGSGMDLVSVTAEGNVVIKDDNGWASGDKAVYDQASEILTLTGSRNLPAIKSADGNSSATATSERTAFTFDRKSGVIQIKGPARFAGSTFRDILTLPGTGTKR